jgi:hypothetical protein
MQREPMSQIDFVSGSASGLMLIMHPEEPTALTDSDLDTVSVGSIIVFDYEGSALRGGVALSAAISGALGGASGAVTIMA